MNKFNYALIEDDYTLVKALTWGNCRAHFKKAINAGDLDGRVIHVLIGLAEFLPILGQVASLIELAVMKIFSKDYSIPLPQDVRLLICSKLHPKDVIALGGTSKLWRIAVDTYCSRQITNIFGNEFSLEKDAVRVFADFWGPIKVESKKLSTLIPRKELILASEQMATVLNAIKSGTLKDLIRSIGALRDSTELTMLKCCLYADSCNIIRVNPLQLAVEIGDIEKVRLLIKCGTPIGAGYDGMIDVESGPLLEAVLRRQEAILRLLLMHGASFSIEHKTWDDREPLLHQMFKRVVLGENDSVILRCIALALRSWRDEKGSEAIQKDTYLAEFASLYCFSTSVYPVIQLLMSYGVSVTIDTTKLTFHSNIDFAIAKGRIGFLEYLRRPGCLNFQEYRNKDGFSLADIAARYGQFELEFYLIKQKQVPYCKREEALEVLKKDVSESLGEMHNADFNTLLYIGGARGQTCTLERFKKIAQHYRIDGV